MNRISHFLQAKTQFNLHSPFIYRLYTEVLFSRAPNRGRAFEDICWRIEEYYHLPHYPSPLPSTSFSTVDGLFLVLDHPHRHEADWQSIVVSSEWQATLDLYSVGIAVRSPRLCKQHFLLR